MRSPASQADGLPGHPREQRQVMEVRSDSIAGVHFLSGGSVIFVRGLVCPERIYVISRGGDVMVKRLRWDRVGRRIAIHSENGSYPDPQHVPIEGDALRIEGKVGGWFHRYPY